MKACPFCAEEIQETATKCRHCGEFVDRARDPVGSAVTGASISQPTLLSDRYEIVRELGRGGMGVVYLARDRERRGAEVAIKVLPPELSNDPKAVEDLSREADLAMSLSHPNIVRLHNLENDREKQTRYLVMEYVRGTTLASLGKVPSDKAVDYVRQGLAGLWFAHRKQIVHRDLKPSNLMLDESGTVKIADFGIARQLQTAKTRLTGSSPTGTLLYMSPEQLRGDEVGPASDLYSMGCVLYELLAGRPPFESGSIEWQILNEAPPVIGGAPAWLTPILDRALAKNPGGRFATAVDFAAALTAQRAEPARVAPPPPRVDPIRAKPPAVTPRPVKPPPPPVLPTPSPPPAPAQTQSSGCGCIFFLILLGLAVYGGYTLYKKEVLDKKSAAQDKKPSSTDPNRPFTTAEQEVIDADPWHNPWRVWRDFAPSSSVSFEYRYSDGRKSGLVTTGITHRTADTVSLQMSNPSGGFTAAAYRDSGTSCVSCGKPLSAHRAGKPTVTREQAVAGSATLECVKVQRQWINCDGTDMGIRTVWLSQTVPGWVVRVEGSSQYGDYAQGCMGYESRK